MDEIVGLPLHPLVVHAAVVLTPLACVAALAYVAVPRWRDWLRWPVAVATVVAVGSVWAAYLTGADFFDSPRFENFDGEILERIETHEGYASVLRWVASGFGVATLAAIALHRREGGMRVLLGLVVAATAIATLVYTVLTGDAGARAVWG